MTYWISSLKMTTSVNLNIPLWKWISLPQQFVTPYQKFINPQRLRLDLSLKRNSAFVAHSLQGRYIPPIIYSSAYVVNARYLLILLLGTSNF